MSKERNSNDFQQLIFHSFHTFISSTKTLSSNTRKSTGPFSSDSQRPQLLDNNGRNVTPKPLVEPRVNAAIDASASSSISAHPPLVPSHSLQEEADNDSHSIGGFSDDGEMNNEGSTSTETGTETTSTDLVPTSEVKKAQTGLHVPASPVGRSRGHAQKREKLTDAELDAIVTLTLTETPTICLFSLKQQRVLQDSQQHKDVALANDRYDAACIAIQKGGPELYPSRGVQTINAPLKSKSVTAAPPQTASEGCQADNWDIYDSVVLGRSNSSVASHHAAAGDGSSVAQAAQKQTTNLLIDKMIDAMVMTALAAPGCLIDADSSVRILPPQSVFSKSSKGAGSKSSNTNTTSSSSSSSSQALASTTAIAKSTAKAANNATVTGTATASNGTAAPTKTTAVAQPPKAIDIEDPVAAAMAEVKAAASSAWASNGGGTGGSDEDGDEEILSASSLLASSSTDGSGGQNGDSGGSASIAADHKNHGHGHTKKPSDKHETKAPNQDAHSSTVEEEIEDGAGPLDVVTQLQANRVLSSRNLLDSLGLVERAVQQNLYHHSHRLYRSGPAQDLLERMLEAGQKKGYSGAAAILSEHTKKGGAGKDHNGNRQDAGTYGFAEGSAEEEAEVGQAIQPSESTKETENETTTQDDEGKEGGGEGKNANESIEEEKKEEGNEDSTELTQKRASSSSSSSIPGLLKLWTFSCKEVEGLNVSSLVWNKANRDLLAVSYGPYDFNQAYTGVGLIALWNLSNPESPLALLHAPDDSGVTAIDFSSSNPSLLAAGLYDGSVCVYNVAKILSGENQTGMPDLCSDQLIPGTHTEAVWQVKYVSTPNAEQGSENIISISTDGKVLEWTTHKGLQFEPLMVLKRARSAPEPGGAGAGKQPVDGKQADKSVDALSATGSEGLLSRTASGLTFDFPVSDRSQYIVGTEDGLLARCSVGYPEQYLDVVKAHSGPINRVRISPFLPNACLTASSDWSVRLWKMNISDKNGGSSSSAKMRPLTYTTDNVHEAMADIAWSPAVATRFASVARDGQIQIWDASSLQPLLDCPITVDEQVWRAQLALEEEEREAEFQRLLEEERNKRRVEDEGIEEDDDFEREVLQAVRKKQAKEAAELEGKTNEAEGGSGGGKSLDDDDEHMGGGNSFEAKQAAALAEKIKKGPPRKKLSCVIFADNTHVLLTGDANGAVDVYRIQGLGGADVLSTRTSVPAAGTEEYESQLSLLDSVLQTMV